MEGAELFRMVGVPPDASYEELTAQVEKLKKKYEGNIKKIKRIEASGAPPPRGCRGGYQPDPSRARADDAPPPLPPGRERPHRRAATPATRPRDDRGQRGRGHEGRGGRGRVGHI